MYNTSGIIEMNAIGMHFFEFTNGIGTLEITPAFILCLFSLTYSKYYF